MAKRGHAGGHGGAWKVAYADFVTSMMALFMVLWLVGSDDETKEAVQRYFKGELTQQGRSGTKEYSNFKPFMTEMVDKASKDLFAIQEFKRAMERLREQLKNSSEMGDDQIRFEFHADGMRITAIDKSKRPFFTPGTADLTEYGTFVLTTIAVVLERQNFTLEVEGHTQSGLELNQQAGKGWDLSTRRAVSAQQELQQGGILSERFYRVAGYADRAPLENIDPKSEENRRITVIVRPSPTDDIETIRDKLSPP